MGKMKLKKEVVLVRAVVHDKIHTEDVDPTRVLAVVEDLCADMPEIKANTLDEADALTKRVMDWLEDLSSKNIRLELSYRERSIVVGTLIDRIDAMHWQLERLLYDMGVVEWADERTKSRSRLM